MKKVNKIMLGVLGVIVAAALVICMITLFKNRRQEPEVVGDISWYDENGKEFTITTVEEFYGLAQLSKEYDFKGQTIKLGADIEVNKGNAKDWEKSAPGRLWTPITGFAGCFNGQGHTISGIYGDSIITSLGLFTDTQKTSVIKNLKLVNSFFKNNNDMGTGSIIGYGGGKVEAVYSDAMITSGGKYVGGLIGRVTVKGENQISSCWFDGTIDMVGNDVSEIGGLVGAFSVADAINVVEHSLSTADIVSMGSFTGGICGNVGSKSYVTFKDSMYTGNLIYDKNKYNTVASVVGQITGSSTVIMEDIYTVDEIAGRTIGTNSGYMKGSAIAVAKTQLLGNGGYQWTTLDFDDYWTTQREKTPRLSLFTDDKEDLTGVERLVDISWYDPAGASFEITTTKEFFGFAYLSRSYDFSGQVIKLGADITVNTGFAKDWGNKAPEYKWTPIAWYGNGLSKRFKGTFDGQGHTISGIYVKGTESNGYIGLFGEIYRSATVKNFKIVNSYFEGTMTSDVRGCVGSVCGRLRGTIEGVYSNAIIVNSAKMTGGIAGMINGTGENKISNCWFDGQLTGVSRCGGILGGVYGNKANLTATVEHCLNTGNIGVKIGYGDVGGMCGIVETWSTLYVNDCLNAGTFHTVGNEKKANTHIGTLVGSVTTTSGVGSRVILNNSFGVKEFYSRILGWKYGAEGISQTCVAFTNMDEVMGYGGYQWTTLDFDNNWAVRVKGVPVPVNFATNRPSLSGIVRMVDYSWFNMDSDVYTIKTFQQLYGFAHLWDIVNQFKGKTVKLGADITINEGNAADWAEKAPSFVWTPARLSGTFDGQGHTISGIYVKGGEEDNYVGLFHRVYEGGAVKNLRLVNSYIEGTMASNKRGATGSIAGRNNGTIDGVYSNAIVVNSAQMTGGIVGMVTGGSQGRISNSWFDGKVTGVSRTGGILGGVYGNKQNMKTTIEHCLNTGEIAVQIGYGDVGGMCGMVETWATLYVNDSLNVGTFKTVGEGKKANTHIGNIVGSVTKTENVGSRAVLSNSYGVKEFYSKLTGWSYGTEGVSQTSVILSDRKELTGYGGYQWTTLDFDNSWAVRTENVPVPVCFAASRPSLSGIVRMVDYSWYNPDSKVLTIKNVQQLNGFAVLCNADNDYFNGKTIKLGADITLNAGNAGEWAENAPALVWTPISLKGTFDGQGHTLSGVYAKTTSTYTGLFNTLYSGATVKNLRLKNSYFEGTKGSTSRAGVGSIAGRNNGTIDSVYSSAIVKNSALMTGGIAGMTTENKEGIIKNCWFAGEIYATGSTGGILGGMYGTDSTNAVALIEHCQNTGTFNIRAGSSAIGGLCGYAQNVSKLTMTDSLSAGSLNIVGSGSLKQCGAALGSIHAKAALSADGVYGVTEFAEKLVGYSGGKEAVQKSAVRKTEDIRGFGACQWTTLDFKNHWALRDGDIPVLALYEKASLNPEDAKDLLDFSWYDAQIDEYTLSTPLQMQAFVMLCSSETDYFKGKTIKLDTDIILNEGDAANWAENAPENSWTPLNLKGTFDGQNHTISGMYVKSTGTYTGMFGTVYEGAFVKNLKITNSYFEGTKGNSSRSGVGSVAGLLQGTVDGVSSDAILKNSALMTGGIAGMVYNAADVKIVNCQFAGQIDAIGSTGGILGGTYGTDSAKTEATIERCLNTGTLNVRGGASNKSTAIGGLCGYIQNVSALTLKNSFNAGSYKKATGNISQIGTVVGALHNNGTLNVSDVYGTMAFSENLIGWKGANKTYNQEEGTAFEALSEEDTKKMLDKWTIR